MKVCVIDKNPVVACYIARQFLNKDKFTDVAVFCPRFNQNSICERNNGDWLDFKGIQHIPGSINNVVNFSPNLLINLNHITGAISQKLASSISQHHNVLTIGCSVMGETIGKEPRLGLTFLENASIDVHPYKVLNSNQALMEYMAVQEQGCGYTIEEGLFYKHFISSNYVDTSLIESTSLITKQSRGPFLVRKENKQFILKMGMMFNGSSIIGNPFFVKETESSIFIHHTIDSVYNILPDLHIKLTKVLAAIGFVGVVFCEINTETMKIRRIDTTCHDAFWPVFCESFAQDFSRYLFSVAKGVSFPPEVKQNSFGVRIESESNLDICLDSEVQHIFPFKFYKEGEGNLIGAWNTHHTFPFYQFNGIAITSIPGICNTGPQVMGQFIPFYNDPNTVITFGLREKLSVQLNPLCVGYNPPQIEPVLGYDEEVTKQLLDNVTTYEDRIEKLNEEYGFLTEEERELSDMIYNESESDATNEYETQEEEVLS